MNSPSAISIAQTLDHLDHGSLWPQGCGLDTEAAYQHALAVRAQRVARGEQPRGYKVGFTNRTIWPRYNVFAPIWGTVYDSTLVFCDGDEGSLTLGAASQPRLEPECCFGMRVTPPAGASLDDLFACIEWVAPSFEVVQCHMPGWKFAVADTVADGGLHAYLLVGRRQPVGQLAVSAYDFEEKLSKAKIVLQKNGETMDEGVGANVLDGPLHALSHFVQAMAACPGAPALKAGDVVTTGTWTDAWPVAPGEKWVAQFDSPLPQLAARFG